MTADAMLEWLERVALSGKTVEMYYTQDGITLSGDVYAIGETLAIAIQNAMKNF